MLAIFLVGALVAAVLPVIRAVSAEAATLPTPPSAVALPTVQIDGVAWQQVVHNDTVYVGGKFGNARPAGAAAGKNTTTRQNMLAYDIKTGALKTGFVANTDGQVLGIAVAPGGGKLYISGEFTKVNGVARNRIAALDLSTGAVDKSFNAGAGSVVHSLAVTGDTVYAGGKFNTVTGPNGSMSRTNLAAFKRSDGSVLNWAPKALNGRVRALAYVPGSAQIAVGGSFNQLNSTAALGLGAVNLSSGGTVSFPINQVIKNGTDGVSAIYSLRADSSRIYGTGYTFGDTGGLGNFEGTFAADAAGNVKWINDGRGDCYDAFTVRGMTFTAGHPHRNANLENGFPERDLNKPTTSWRAIAQTAEATGKLQPATSSYNFGGQPSPTLLHWFPNLQPGTYTGQSQAAWTVAGNNQYVAMGGEFLKVSGTSQQGLVRFAFRDVNASTVGPMFSGANFKPDVTSPASGVAQISWLANWDVDDERLNYTVEREGSGTIATYSGIRANHYERPVITHLDKGRNAGATHRYRIVAKDPSGKTATGDWVSVKVNGSGSLSNYAQAVLSDRPETYFRLGESSGAAVDSAFTYNGTATSGVTRGVAGAISGDSNKAYTFNGNQTVHTNAKLDTPRAMSTEAWFKTTSTKGGAIVGWGDKQTGLSGQVDYMTYMGNDGKVRFAVDERGKKAVTSPKAYNDGKWHHVVSTLDWWSGQRLYVDGALVASNANVKHARDFYGYWRIGGDSLSGQPSAPASHYFNGQIDEVATYREAVPSGRVTAHFNAGKSGTAGVAVAEAPAPTAPAPAAPAPAAPAPAAPAPAAPVPAGKVVLDDRFSRTLASGWGAASPGGAWSLSGGVSSFAVNGGDGTITLPAGATRRATLPVSGANLDMTTVVALGSKPTGGGAYLSLGTRASSGGEYVTRLKYTSDGKLAVHHQRQVGGTVTTIGGKDLALTQSPNEKLYVRLQISGSGTTTLKAKVWKSGAAEPANWDVTSTDSTAALQGSGAIYVQGYNSASATAPLVVKVAAIWANSLG